MPSPATSLRRCSLNLKDPAKGSGDTVTQMMSSPPILSRREYSLNLLTLWSPSHAKEAPRRVMCCQTCQGHQSKAMRVRRTHCRFFRALHSRGLLVAVSWFSSRPLMGNIGNGSKATHNGKNGQGSSFLECIGHQHHLRLLLPMIQSPHPCNALEALMRRGWLIQGIRS